MSDVEGKTAPTVQLQSAAAAHIEKVAQDDIVGLEADAQAVLAHVRSLEARFMTAVSGLGSSAALDHAKTAMMAARQWVVTHLTT